jgi:Spy/CpxP family protein refolding chaperone
MKTRYFIPKVMASIALMALTIPLPAFSQMMEMGHMDKMEEMMGMCIQHADKMELSDAQIQKMKPAHSEMQKKQARFKADHKIAEIELMEIMDVKDFDLEKATAAAKKIAKITTDHQLEMLKGMKEMRSLLTADQFKNMHKMMAMKPDDKKHSKNMKK